MTRWLLAVVVVVGLVVGARPTAAFAETSSSPRAVEVELIGRINALRERKGLRPLAEDRADLTAMARAWSSSMAREGGISHRTDLTTAAPADWVKVGENVGVGGTARSLHDAFVASPMHLRNLVDPEFESVGVGVVVRDGRLWVTENFLRAAPAGSTPEPAAFASVSAPPGGLGHRICVTARCRARFVLRRIAFIRA